MIDSTLLPDIIFLAYIASYYLMLFLFFLGWVSEKYSWQKSKIKYWLLMISTHIIVSISIITLHLLNTALYILVIMYIIYKRRKFLKKQELKIKS